jgi:hypothetical protein
VPPLGHSKGYLLVVLSSSLGVIECLQRTCCRGHSGRWGPGRESEQLLKAGCERGKNQVLRRLDAGQ